MFIGICGAICSGKRSIAHYLVDKHSFQLLQLIPSQASSSIAPSLARTPEPVQDALGDAYNQLLFNTPGEMLEYATKNYKSNFVTTTIPDETALELLAQRPFFILISVDAPVTVRYERWKSRAHPNPTPTLESFLHASDIHLYHPTHGLLPLLSRATLRLVNPSNNLSTLHSHLSALNLVDPSRLRPSWDAYFMQLASLAARRSNCMKRRVGCVLVREGRVIATGYNGVAKGMRNCNDGGCPRCNGKLGLESGAGLQTCLCLHAEENALLEAGRERVGNTAILYCDTCPCLTCAIKIVQVGIKEVIYRWGYSMDDATARVMKEGGVKLTQFEPPRDGLINMGLDSDWHSNKEVLSLQEPDSSQRTEFWCGKDGVVDQAYKTRRLFHSMESNK